MDVPIPPAHACPPDATLVALLEGRLSGPPLLHLEEHVETCSACRAILEELTTGRTVPVRAIAEAIGEALGRGASIGRYLVLSLIGRGGMGEVYAAYDPELDRRVALKLLHTARGSEEARARLVREARALGKLSHPNVVQVHDVGEHRGDVFVAMELVEGRSFDAWCKGPPEPGWREVLAAYLDAARGLAAAHEKGLVHRDVKPGNLLHGDDGRVRVADFGLAAAGREGGRPGPPARGPEGTDVSLGETLPATPAESGERLTATGAIVGTPLYMAPEQYEGTSVGPASDQYSLCAALYEGLYGVRPFTAAPDAAGATLDRLLARKREGLPASPPAGSSVPPWIHRVLVRGLAPEPEDRYPSLPALIDALGDDPEARRRGRWARAGLGAGAALLLALAAAGWAKSGAFQDPCAHAERQLSGVWDGGVAGRVRAALLGTGRSHAEGTAGRVTALLDRYAHDWAAMRGEVCEASRSGKQRRELGGLRDECLDRRLAQLHALTSLLAEKPDAQVLDKAVQAAAELRPVAYCADTEALTARVRPPDDPALRARVKELNPRVDRVEALFTAGKYKDGLALAEPLLADPIPYAPLRARLQFWAGSLYLAVASYDKAKPLLQAAAISAGEGRDDALASDAWARLLVLVGDRQQHLEEAALIHALAPVVVHASDERSQAGWLYAEGVVYFAMGKLPEARDAQERALALRERILPPDHPSLATSLNGLGAVLRAMEDYTRAQSMLERAVATYEKALGPEHPNVAGALNNLGAVRYDLGDFPGALSAYERALAIHEKVLGPDHPNVAMSLCNVGTAFFQMDDLPRAQAAFERALAIWEKALGPNHPDLAFALLGLGRTRVRLGHLDAAQPVIERLRALREKEQGPTQGRLAGPLLSLGELSLARHEPAQAVPLLERALTVHDSHLQPEIRLALAEALWQVGDDRARARDLVEQTRAEYEKLGHRPGLDRATRWLSEHPREAK